MAKDLIHGTEIVAVRAQELRVGDLVGPGCEVTEVRQLAPLKVLVRTSTGHSDVCAPGRWYHVAADRPNVDAALAPATDPKGAWYCALCDQVVVVERHAHTAACALAQEDRHPCARP